MLDPTQRQSTDSAPRRGECLLTVWGTGPGSFAARAVLPDGTQQEFDGAMDLARLLRSLGWLAAPAPPSGPGLR